MGGDSHQPQANMSKTAMARRHNPLEDDITTAGGRLRTKSITGKRKSRSDENAQGDGYIDAQSSRKILAIAQDLADEDAEDRKLAAAKPGPQSNAAFGFDSRFATDEDADDQDPGLAARYDDDEGEWIPEEEEVVAEEEMDPEDMAVYRKFLQDGEELADFTPSIAHLMTEDRRPKGMSAVEDDEEGEATNLTDLILQRIAEKEALEAARNAGSQHQTFLGSGPPDEVVETFTKVGQLLSRYKSGPLPKPFKVLPTLPQ